jgi:zinc transporter ZupT
MGWLIMIGIGFVMNFLTGFIVNGFAFGEFKPLHRAIAVASLCYAICTVTAALVAYYYLGSFFENIASRTFFAVAVAYILPAIVHGAVLHYLFNKGWTDPDMEQAC